MMTVEQAKVGFHKLMAQMTSAMPDLSGPGPLPLEPQVSSRTAARQNALNSALHLAHSASSPEWLLERLKLWRDEATARSTEDQDTEWWKHRAQAFVDCIYLVQGRVPTKQVSQ